MLIDGTTMTGLAEPLVPAAVPDAGVEPAPALAAAAAAAAAADEDEDEDEDKGEVELKTEAEKAFSALPRRMRLIITLPRPCCGPCRAAPAPAPVPGAVLHAFALHAFASDRRARAWAAAWAALATTRARRWSSWCTGTVASSSSSCARA